MAVDERVDDRADVRGGVDAPVLQHRAGHGAEPLDRQVPDPLGQLLARDMARLVQLLDGVL